MENPNSSDVRSNGSVNSRSDEAFCAAIIRPATERTCTTHDDELLWFFLSLFVIVAWGALVRSILRMTKLNFPYTVILMMTGIVIGCGTHIPQYDFCSFWSKFTLIARVPPKTILYAFLPVIIFESAYNMNVHVFMRSLTQILVLSLPGMILGVFMTGWICEGMMTSYRWDFGVALMYGSIISATDPVAVVAILKELGTSETLSTLIEGESLLNDGTAILMFEIFEEVVVKEPGVVLHIGIAFLKIGVGGPAFGYAAGKLCSMLLANIFNDAATEITITLFSSYIVYWVGEALGISGVISVCVLALKLNADSTSISPEVEKMIHHFWSMVAYLSNTVLFVLVGIILSETAISQIGAEDWFNLFLLYVVLNIVRLMMLMMLMPWLTRIGYGLNWKDMVVSMWGGVRGAVGLCLSLEVYYSSKFCELLDDQIGPKFLFHTAGIVFLTLVLNGTTTKVLLAALHLSDVSPARVQDMNNVVKHVISTQNRALLQYRHDRFLADADWVIVEKFTKIHDPYTKKDKQKETLESIERSDSDMSSVKVESKIDLSKIEILKTKTSKSDHSPNQSTGGENTGEGVGVSDEEAAGSDDGDDYESTKPKTVGSSYLSLDEFKQQTEESRHRLLKAFKVSFWRQYEQGILSDLAVQVLLRVADKVEDQTLRMMHADDFERYFVVHEFFNWFRLHFIDATSKKPPEPLSQWKHCFWTLATNEWFGNVITIMIIVNMVPATWEFVWELSQNDSREVYWNYKLGFLVSNVVVTGIFFMEFLIKTIGYGFSGYFKTKWHWIDTLILVVGIIDICCTMAYLTERIGANTNTASSGVAIVVRTFRMLKLIPSLRFLKCFVNRANEFLDTRINYRIFLGYDIGTGFVTAVDDVLKFLPQMVTHENVLYQLEQSLRLERLETIRLLGLLQQAYHSIAIAVKTRHASRAILNQMRETLGDLKDDGLLDKNESAVLNSLIERKMKNLWSTPATITPNSTQETLSNILWLNGAPELSTFIQDNATLLQFSKGDTICDVGDVPNGIYLIVQGMVKVHFMPTVSVLQAQISRGELPNSEIFGDMTFCYQETDYLQEGYVIGEIGIVTQRPSASKLTCETDTTVYHVTQKAMIRALKEFKDENDTLECRIWRAIGLRVASALLPAESEYQSWTLGRIRVHVEHSAVPIGPQFETMTIPEFICDLVLLQGRIQDSNNKTLYTAPLLLPRSCKKLAKVQGSTIPTRFLVIADADTKGVAHLPEDEYEPHVRMSILSTVLNTSRPSTKIIFPEEMSPAHPLLWKNKSGPNGKSFESL